LNLLTEIPIAAVASGTPNPNTTANGWISIRWGRLFIALAD
jgi:hypothetical protein